MSSSKFWGHVDNICVVPFPVWTSGATEQLAAIRDLETRNDDVLICAYPKSGTHWLWEVTCMLVRGKAEYLRETKVSAFLDFLPMSEIDQLPSRRVLNTHLCFRHVPKSLFKNGGKVMHIRRNPKDVAVSSFCHFWHMPGVDGVYYQPDWNEHVDIMFSDKAKELACYGGWFQYELEWEAATGDNPDLSMLSLQYEDLKRDLVKEVKKIAAFLEVPCSEELAKEIAEKCQFENLKRCDEEIKAVTKIAKDKEDKSFVFRKGEVGDWRNWFTEDQNKSADAYLDDKMKYSNITCTYEL